VADPIVISTDAGLLDFDVIHGFLVKCYWSPGIPRAAVERAAANSMCFGVYDTVVARGEGDSRPRQVGFARVVTDRATFAYLADVFVLDAYRGRGLSKRLMAFIMAHPDLQGLRRFMLLTRDAHGLYEQYGFKASARPEAVMEKWDPDVYKRSEE
jgi:GNAT superfamily N-acetyltransferase